MKNKIRSISPVLSVNNIKESISWYKEQLDFKEIYINKEENDSTGESWNYALLECNGVEIHLALRSNSDKTLSSPTNIYMFINEISNLHKKLKANNCNISNLENMPWGNLECSLTDINENKIVLSQPPSA